MAIVTIPKSGEYGVIKDQPAQELPINAWSDSANIRFREGGAERFKGEKQLFDTPAVTPYWLQQYNQGGKRWWIHAGTGKLFADDGVGARSEITPTSAPTGAIDDRWTGGVMNGVLVANNAGFLSFVAKKCNFQSSHHSRLAPLLRGLLPSLHSSRSLNLM